MNSRGVRQSAKNKTTSDCFSGKNEVLSVKCITDSDLKGKIIFEGEQELNKKRMSLSRRTIQKEEDRHGRNQVDITKSAAKTRKCSGRQSLIRGIVEEKRTEIGTKLPNSASGRKRVRPRTIVETDDDNSNYEGEYEQCEKPSGLCDDEDVAGNEMCSFRTPKKRQGMYQKALESAGKINNSGTPTSKLRTPKLMTPSSNCTPKKIMPVAKNTPTTISTPNKHTASKKHEPFKLGAQTPYNLRAKNKTAIQTHVRSLQAFDDEEDSDYSGSLESISESDEPKSDEDGSSSESDKSFKDSKPPARRSLLFHNIPSAKRKSKDTNYVFTAEEYFESQSSKCSTSDRRLSRLQTPRLDRHALQDLLSNCSVSHSHILAKKLADDRPMFQRWMFALSQGFSVLAYGLGSKHKILQRFHNDMLSDSHVLVVNGFFPTLNVKEIVEMIARDLLGLKQVLPSSHAHIDWIENRRRMPRVFLLVHNLDAEALRCEKTQSIFSRLASLPRVHLVASVDHINCPLLWDQAKLSEFNFMWEDTTSFLPYQEETSYETSLMVQNSGSLALSSLLNVYRSLPQNSKGVFRILLEKHLEESNSKYNGMAFSTLYKKCRDEMLVTSDLLLRTMLNEFLDHEMAKWRRDSEHLYIPVESGVLQQFHKIVQEI